jgi:hypothetical protein
MCNTIAEEVIDICLPDYRKKKEKPAASHANPEKIVWPEGTWEGSIKVDDKDIPLSMIFQDDGDVIIKMAAQFETKWVFPYTPENLEHRMMFNVFQLNNYWMFGWYLGTIPSEDVQRYPHIIMLDLRRGQNIIRGVAQPVDTSNRMHYGLSYYIELTKK